MPGVKDREERLENFRARPAQRAEPAAKQAELATGVDEQNAASALQLAHRQRAARQEAKRRMRQQEAAQAKALPEQLVGPPRSGGGAATESLAAAKANAPDQAASAADEPAVDCVAGKLERGESGFILPLVAAAKTVAQKDTASHATPTVAGTADAFASEKAAAAEAASEKDAAAEAAAEKAATLAAPPAVPERARAVHEEVAAFIEEAETRQPTVRSQKIGGYGNRTILREANPMAMAAPEAA